MFVFVYNRMWKLWFIFGRLFVYYMDFIKFGNLLGLFKKDKFC